MVGFAFSFLDELMQLPDTTRFTKLLDKLQVFIYFLVISLSFLRKLYLSYFY